MYVASLLMRSRIGGWDAKTRSHTLLCVVGVEPSWELRKAASSWLPKPSCAARRSAWYSVVRLAALPSSVASDTFNISSHDAT